MVTLVIGVDGVKGLGAPDLEPPAVEDDQEHGHDDDTPRHHGHQDQEQGGVLWNVNLLNVVEELCSGI